MAKYREYIAQPEFYRNPTPYHHFRLGIGETPERPFKLFAFVNANSFGDFANALHVVLQYAARFEHSLTRLAFVDNRLYKRDLLQLYPLPREFMVFPKPEDLKRVDLTFFEPNHKRLYKNKPVYRPATDIVADPHWYDIIFPWIHLQQVLRYERTSVPCVIPSRLQAELHSQLVGLGLDENRWFSCMHYREPTYRWKNRPNLRDCDPEVYLPVIDHIINRLGGQVVRIGHPEMRDHPPRARFVDLAKVPNSTLLQAYAASRARFSVMGPGGGTCLVRLFHGPLGLTDAATWFDGVNEHDFLLTHTVITPDGRELRQESLFESGLMNQRALEEAMRRQEGFRIVKNTSEQICQTADFMYEYTSSTPGWRPSPTPPAGPFDNVFCWPLRGTVGAKFVDL